LRPLNTSSTEIAAPIEGSRSDCHHPDGTNADADSGNGSRRRLGQLDMNAPHDVDTCIRFANDVAIHDIFWLEELLHWYLQPADYVTVANASPIPLAHGEREWHRFTVRDFIDSGAIRFVQFDCTRHGGFSEALRIARHAAEKDVLVAPHSASHLQAHIVSALGDAAFGAESSGDDRNHPVHHRIFEGALSMTRGVCT
jgi:L-alanine-DL-glutamate epimerase-like enolase superfamily enzyme